MVWNCYAWVWNILAKPPDLVICLSVCYEVYGVVYGLIMAAALNYLPAHAQFLNKTTDRKTCNKLLPDLVGPLGSVYC